MSDFSFLAAYHYFLEKDWEGCARTANAYLWNKYREPEVLSVRLRSTSSDLDWPSWIISNLLEGKSQFPLGLLAKEIWLHQPSQLMLECLAFLDWGRIRHLQRHTDEAAFGSACGELIMGFVTDACRIGIIQTQGGQLPLGFLPVLDTNFFEELEARQLNDYFSIRLKNAVAGGLLLKQKQPREATTRDGTELWMRAILSFLFENRGGINFLTRRLEHCSRSFPHWIEPCVTAIHSFSAVATPSEVEFLVQDYVILVDEGVSAVDWMLALATAISKADVSYLPSFQPLITK